MANIHCIKVMERNKDNLAIEFCWVSLLESYAQEPTMTSVPSWLISSLEVDYFILMIQMFLSHIR